MRVLVTGGGGFIGSHLVRALLRRGDGVRVLDDWSTGLRSRLDALAAELRDDPQAGPAAAARLEILDGDVRDPLRAAEACAGMDAVSHQAAQVSVAASVEDPRATADVNVVGLATMLAAARAARCRSFVLASSCAVYGESPAATQSESAPPAPASPYAASKLAGEAFVAAACREGLRGVSLRYFNVYGEGQRPDSAYAAVVPAFVTALRAGREPEIHGDGSQSRDLVSVHDVVRANLLALGAPDAAIGRAFNVGTGRATTVLELAESIARAFGHTLRPRFAPPRAGDVRRSLADTTLASGVLGFSATVPLQDGLARMI